MADARQIHFPIKLKSLRKHTLESVTGEPHPATREERHPQSLRGKKAKGKKREPGSPPAFTHGWQNIYSCLNRHDSEDKIQNTNDRVALTVMARPASGDELMAAGRRGRLGSLGGTCAAGTFWAHPHAFPTGEPKSCKGVG